MSKKSIDKRQIKQQLKTMLKNGKTHRLRDATRVTKYGTNGFTRNIWLSVSAVFVMSITIIIVFATLFANIVLLSITDSMRDKIDITVYLKPDTTGEQLSTFSNLLYKNPNVRLVETSNSEQELQKFTEERKNSPEILNALKDPEMHELLLKSMNATIIIKLKNIDEIGSVKHTIEQTPELQSALDTKKPPTYETKRTIIDRIRSWATTARIGGITLGIIFLTVSILMIINTIRIAIFSRREEIYMMKLVGASNSFIKGPFLVEAEISGILSGIIAGIVSLIGLNFILPYLASTEINPDLFSRSLKFEYAIILIMSMVITGAIIGSVSARIAIKKYINKQ